MSTAPDRNRRGLGRGLEVLIGGATSFARARPAPARVDPPERAPAEAALRRRGNLRARRFRAGAGSRPARRRSPDLRRRLGADRGRAALARRTAAGLATIPALVRETDDRESLLLALVENVAREDLSPIEEARAYAVLMDEFSLSLGDVAERVGRSKPTVSNRIRLLELPEDVIGLLERGLITEGHARAILAVPGHDQRRALARQVVRKGLTVRATERAARWAGAKTKPRKTRAHRPGAGSPGSHGAESIVGSAVRVTDTRIEIPFSDETELEEIIEAFERVRP